MRTGQRHQSNKPITERAVIAKLSIIVAPNKRGDIIVRESQDDPANLSHLVKNFVVCYGLKKEMFTVIYDNLVLLIENNKKMSLNEDVNAPGGFDTGYNTY